MKLSYNFPPKRASVRWEKRPLGTSVSRNLMLAIELMQRVSIGLKNEDWRIFKGRPWLPNHKHKLLIQSCLGTIHIKYVNPYQSWGRSPRSNSLFFWPGNINATHHVIRFTRDNS